MLLSNKRVALLSWPTTTGKLDLAKQTLRLLSFKVNAQPSAEWRIKAIMIKAAQHCAVIRPRARGLSIVVHHGAARI